MDSTETNIPGSRLIATLKDTLQSGKYSDLTLKCKDKEFKVHKMIVCTQSAPIAAAIDGNFPEGKTSTYEFLESEPEDIEKMINFLYTGDYNPPPPPPTEPPSPSLGPGPPMLDSVKMYLLGDAYQIPALKALASTNFKYSLTRLMDHRVLGTCLNLLYTQTREEDRELKDAVVESIALSGVKVDILLESKDIRDAVAANGRLGLDLILEIRRVTIADEERQRRLTLSSLHDRD